MKEIKIRITTIEDVKEFINISDRCPVDIDLCSDRYTVNGKSIMGIFSLDLSKEILMRIYTKEEDIIKPFNKFIV